MAKGSRGTGEAPPRSGRALRCLGAWSHDEADLASGPLTRRRRRARWPARARRGSAAGFPLIKFDGAWLAQTSRTRRENRAEAEAMPALPLV